MALVKNEIVPSFSCEIRIIQAQNVGIVKNLFARLYLPVGNNRSNIQLNTKMVSSISNVPFWNESFSLDCSCPQEFLETLKDESLMLEIRQSNAATKVLRKFFGGSRLVRKGEIPWKTILESQNMEFKEWVNVDSCDDEDTSTSTSTTQVQVEIKIRLLVASENKENSRNQRWNECGCKHGHDHHAWCSIEDYHVFSALEAF